MPADLAVHSLDSDAMLAIHTGMANENLLSHIPGDCVAAAAKTLPDAQHDTEPFRDVTVDLPDGLKARIRFERFHSKRGKMSRRSWNPHSAERIE